jgi:HEAT repeat protein
MYFFLRRIGGVMFNELSGQRERRVFFRPGRVLLIAAVTAAVMTAGSGKACRAQDLTDQAPAQTPEVPSDLVDQANMFMHYSLLGDQQLAHDFGQAILNANPNPVDLLHAFEQAANGRDVAQILIDNQQNDSLRDISIKIADLLQQGQIALARNPARIQAAIEHMGDSPRAYVVSREQLRAAGEFAATFFFHYLNDPNEKQLDPFIFQMMNDLGKPLLNPTVQQLSSPVISEKIALVSILGNIGYPQALPYLKAIAVDADSTPDLVSAANTAIDKIDPRGQFSQLSASQLFMWLAWGYFHNQSSLAPNQPAEPTNPIWYFDKGLDNVAGIDVPTPIWKDIQTMRACEAALALDPSNSEAISLWLAANIRREVDLPSGATDPTQPAGTPDAHYYAVAAGPVYLNPVLQIALQQENSAMILKVIAALSDTGGVQGLVGNGSELTPLIQAMSYPDTQVRFQASVALAAANPKSFFNGSDRVVPVLAEAIAQTSKPVAVLVDPNPENLNRLKAQLRDQFDVIDAPVLSEAVLQIQHMPYIALIILPSGNEALELQTLSSTDERLAYTPVLVTAQPDQLTQLHNQYINQPTYGEVSVTADGPTVISAYNSILTRLGGPPPSDADAVNFSIQAAALLDSIAVNRASIYDVNVALPALEQGLQNSNSQVVEAVAQVMGHMANPEAQNTLAQAALNSQNQESDLRQNLYMALASSARNAGDHLSSDQIDALIQVVTNDTDAAVKIAAAEALGALNVPSNQASALIRGQAK